MSNELKKIRDRIDALDERIVDLLNERAALAQAVGRAKRNGAKYSPEREAQVLRRLTVRSQGPLSKKTLSRLYVEIISACRALEDTMNVAYLGPAGTFSEEAAVKQFGGDSRFIACASIDEVFRTVEAGHAGYGVVPIENSTEGGIGRTHDLLLTTPLKICSEILLAVHQCLMSKSGNLKSVKKVFSHAQSLAQCHEWLSRQLPTTKRTAVVSNAEAARLASRDTTSAALGSRRAAILYGLKIIAGNIEDEPQNSTRFLVVASHDAGPSGNDKTSLILSAPNAPGAVHALLAPLSFHGVSMTRFESRPAGTGRWEYLFYVDIEGHREDSRVSLALEEVGAVATFLKNLGSYPVGTL